MTKIVKRTSMPNYKLKGILVSGKPYVYVGTSGYPTCHYRGMDLPCGKTEGGYGMGITGRGWIPGKYKQVNGDVIIERQPEYPVQWSAKKRYFYFTNHYEPYAKKAEEWRKEHGVKEEIVEEPESVKQVKGLLKGAHEVVYDGEVKELTRPVRHPSKKGVLVVKTGKITDEGKKFIAEGAASVKGMSKKMIAAVVGVVVVVAVLIGRKI